MKRAIPALLLAAVVVAAIPALGGDWVYDDRIMLGHPALDELADVPSAFSSNSATYLQAHGAQTVQGSVTYRPLPMISFIVVNGTVGENPLAHHVMSLLFHLLAVAGLLALNRGNARGQLLIGVFALHPALGEAYHWINGRSDAMAGLALVGLMALGVRRQLWARALVPGVCLLGLLCKETFLLPAGALIACWWFTDRRGAVVGLLSLVGATAAFFWLRSQTLVGATPVLPNDLSLMLVRAPRIVAIAVETLLVPVPRPMRTLAWELNQPWTIAQGASLLIAVVGLGALLWRKHFRALFLCTGALATLLPPALVADWFWLGFDRYLYLPALLCVWAALPLPGGVSARARVVAGAVLVGLAAASFCAAGSFRSHSLWTRSMVDARPEDPTGYIWAARDFAEHGDLGATRSVVEKMPASQSAPALAHEITLMQLRLRMQAEAIALVEATYAENPDNHKVRYDLLLTRVAQRRWPEAIALAEDLLARPSERDATRAFLQEQLVRAPMPPDISARITALVR